MPVKSPWLNMKAEVTPPKKEVVGPPPPEDYLPPDDLEVIQAVPMAANVKKKYTGRTA